MGNDRNAAVRPTNRSEETCGFCFILLGTASCHTILCPQGSRPPAPSTPWFLPWECHESELPDKVTWHNRKRDDTQLRLLACKLWGNLVHSLRSLTRAVYAASVSPRREAAWQGVGADARATRFWGNLFYITLDGSSAYPTQRKCQLPAATPAPHPKACQLGGGGPEHVSGGPGHNHLLGLTEQLATPRGFQGQPRIPRSLVEMQTPRPQLPACWSRIAIVTGNNSLKLSS